MAKRKIGFYYLFLRNYIDGVEIDLFIKENLLLPVSRTALLTSETLRLLQWRVAQTVFCDCSRLSKPRISLCLNIIMCLDVYHYSSFGFRISS